jgi:hypothetical protein
MKHRYANRILSLLGTVLVLGACSDLAEPTQPEAGGPDGPSPLMSVTCTASTEAKTVSCAAPDRAGGGAAFGLDGQVHAVIIGGQGENVALTSSNIQVVADTFAFDVSVQNLIAQPLGTTDGVNLDSTGVRVFFSSGPNSAGSGTVTVANPDGTGTFTSTSQPFFQYDEVLDQNEVSPTKQWKIQFTPDVTSFTFTVYVAAAVQYPDGYVDGTPNVVSLNPGETRTLTGTVRGVTGRELPGETVSWSTSDDVTYATVTGSQITAGASNGVDTLTASSGVRPAIDPTAVSVCPATVVTDGMSIPAEIASTDCRSSFGGPGGRPNPSYYADLYRVTLTAGQTLTVSMDSGGSFDTYLLLADLDFGRLVDSGDNGMVYTATESGVFVIEASTFDSLDTGAYTLSVTIS